MVLKRIDNYQALSKRLGIYKTTMTISIILSQIVFEMKYIYIKERMYETLRARPNVRLFM